jgi:NYN domain
MCSNIQPSSKTTTEYTRPPDLASPTTAALFVDFDNIYLALGGRTNGNGNHAEPPSPAAQNFAMHPERWLAWIEHGMPGHNDNGNHGPQRRSVLIRRCYLNPGRFGRSRAHFVNAAFSVIDCPFLSHYGKNSADIHMVMDILDTLEHHTHFDEFIIFSGDSDFTPVLLRLREHNRRTTILTIGPAVEAYIAAADRVIDGPTFIEDALEFGRCRPELRLVTSTPGTAASPSQSATAENDRAISETPSSATAAPIDNDHLKAQIVACVQEIVARAAEPISLATVATKVRQRYGAQIEATNWAGTGGFKKLLQSVVELGLEIVTAANHPGYLLDPARHDRAALIAKVRQVAS